MISRYVLEAVAITLVFTLGTIFKGVREYGPKLWQELASCSLCVGVWIGMGWHVLRALPDAHMTILMAQDVLASGAVTGVVALLFTRVLSLLDRYS